ncbi:cupin domain-containing protein [Tetragenococcus koreensis]|uniref:cupin domain-containing protein n=1 Tax=Tetragenococcus koreensis TaxID=290335 RepID=UPI001F244DBF|nr:cupin domain-containing protein [Tetragenococcus koreensis]MDN6264452.1 cupin domain-containing protein [Tetragenococcus halophilus]MCF1585785.1 cupin domain-containing protein [Tetragenococcus koreensis]MCF1615377.1 cupin domain-containing protein [Tetragenococcus koreensis]MCF1617984.1 cupin domain-containing protein [Tetragenococcus koreensis]MCF1619118.1 cupin domain-containing protein [Tetragenococcus koreensis]
MKKQEEIIINDFYFTDDGSIPNHPSFPLLIYKNAIEEEDELEQILAQNNWSNAWRNGVFPYHHYHSNSHEVLVVVGGSALLQMGGENGKKVEAERGDVLILPAGTGHKLLQKAAGFSVIGAYPNGQDFDICYGKKEERSEKLANIKKVSLPDHDPIYGKKGKLFSYWQANNG